MSEVHKLIVGNTQKPIAAILMDGSDPVDLSSLTVKVLGKTVNGSAWISLGTTGVTKHPTQTFTASASTDRIAANGHKVKAGNQIVVSNSGGALPAGLAAATRYYAVEVEPNTFKVSLNPEGVPVNITDAGTGTHSFYIVGSVQYDFQTADVATRGRYRLFFVTEDGSSETAHYPVDSDGLVVVVEDAAYPNE